MMTALLMTTWHYRWLEYYHDMTQWTYLLIVRSSDISTACLSCSSVSLVGHTLTSLQFVVLLMLPCEASVRDEVLSTAEDTGRGLTLVVTSRADWLPAVDGTLQLVKKHTYYYHQSFIYRGSSNPPTIDIGLATIMTFRCSFYRYHKHYKVHKNASKHTKTFQAKNIQNFAVPFPRSLLR